MTLQTLLPALRHSIKIATNPSDVLEKIRETSDRESKLALWTELKVLSLTRCLCNLSGSALAALLLRAQMSVLGGRVYRQTTKKEDMVALTERTQEAFLSLCHEYVSTSVLDLTRRVREIVERDCAEMRLQNKFTAKEMENVLSALVKKSLCVDSLVDFVNKNRTAIRVEDFDEAEIEGLEELFDDLTDVLTADKLELSRMLERLTRPGLKQLREKLCDRMGDVEELPLAKLVPMLSGIYEGGLEGGVAGDAWLVQLMTDDGMRSLAANVYETFCGHDGDVCVGRRSDDFYAEPDFVGGAVKFVRSVFDY